MRKTKLIIDLFNKLNSEYFSNELPLPRKIVFKKVKSYLGQFSYKNDFPDEHYWLSFSTSYKMTDFELEKVLIHEMVHVWQWFNKKDLGHGVSFKRKASEINLITNNKYNIARCTSIKDNHTIGNKIFEGFVITYKKYGIFNKELFAVCENEIYLKYLQSWVHNDSHLYDFRCYAVKGKFYNEFTKSRKRLIGYDKTNIVNSILNKTIQYEKIDF